MKFCTNCGEALPADAAFCTQCGHQVAAPAGAPHPPGPATGTAPAVAPPTNLAAPVSSHLDSVPWADLVPLRVWWSDGQWRQGWVGLFCLFAVAPFLVLRLTGEDQDIQRIAWGFALYFALLWFVVLYALIQPEDRDWWRLGRIAVATAFAGTAIAIFLEKHIAPDDTSLVTMVLGVGVPEEFAKALAVYFFVFRSSRPSSTRTYLFAGAVSGLAFGAAEAVSYTQRFADLASYMSPSSYTALVTWRLLTDSLLHAILAGICAYFIGLAYADPQRRWVMTGAGLGLAAVLHGAYDAWAANWAGTLTAALIVFIFAGYVRSGDRIAERLAAAAPTHVHELGDQ